MPRPSESEKYLLETVSVYQMPATLRNPTARYFARVHPGLSPLAIDSLYRQSRAREDGSVGETHSTQA